ncbi:MAG: peptidylprolyl isomerase [gamma proteobacterium symbiont of Taylorina sp.]|nr:peptidylprolyl isomerase [gamma proteobacterium symbiont of Taylorina sp.]
MTKQFSVTLLLTILLTSFSVTADNTETVIATVNGIEITSRQLSETSEKKFNVDISTLNADQKKNLVDSLINRQIILEQAKKEGFEQSDSMVFSIKQLIDTYIVRQYMTKIATENSKISENTLKAYYEKEYLNKPQTSNFNIKHILLTNEDEAKILLQQLSRGADFSTLAKANSKDMVSMAKGGHLGWMGADEMVPAFYQAVAKLSKGEIAPRPVKTQFGWHIISLVDQHELTPPSFDKVKLEIKQEIIKQQLLDYIDNLKANAVIEIK